MRRRTDGEVLAVHEADMVGSAILQLAEREEGDDLLHFFRDVGEAVLLFAVNQRHGQVDVEAALKTQSLQCLNHAATTGDDVIDHDHFFLGTKAFGADDQPTLAVILLGAAYQVAVADQREAREMSGIGDSGYDRIGSHRQAANATCPGRVGNSKMSEEAADQVGTFRLQRGLTTVHVHVGKGARFELERLFPPFIREVLKEAEKAVAHVAELNRKKNGVVFCHNSILDTETGREISARIFKQ